MLVEYITIKITINASTSLCVCFDIYLLFIIYAHAMTKHRFMKQQDHNFAVDNTNLGSGVRGFVACSELLFLV